jgi:L,D-peptidoglycan transpeptidase YkuD (ErfK/YbiS/YcfS/YnhG family)
MLLDPSDGSAMRRTQSSCLPDLRWTLIPAIALTVACAAAIAIAPRATAAPLAALTRSVTAEGSADTTPLPLPALMADTSGARQLLIATAPMLGDTTGTLQVFNLVGGEWKQMLSVPARFGKNGLMDGRKRKAGNKTTPTGIWAMPNYVFGTHAHAPAGTKMKYRRLTSRSWWSSKRGKTYNTWVEARRWTGEHIGGSPKAYEFAVSTGYNARPNRSVYGLGTGIFLHVREAGLTAGCVSVSRTNMIRICKLLDRSKAPHFAIGTLQAGTPTSIWAY